MEIVFKDSSWSLRKNGNVLVTGTKEDVLAALPGLVGAGKITAQECAEIEEELEEDDDLPWWVLLFLWW